MKVAHLNQASVALNEANLPELRSIDYALSWRAASPFIETYNQGRRKQRWTEKQDSLFGFVVSMMRVELGKLRKSNPTQYAAYWSSSNADGIPFRTTNGQIMKKVARILDCDDEQKRNFNKTLKRRLQIMQDAGFLTNVTREGRGNVFYRLWINPKWLMVSEPIVMAESASDSVKMPASMAGDTAPSGASSDNSQPSDNQFFKTPSATKYTPSSENLKDFTLDLIKKNKKQIGDFGDKYQKSLNNKNSLKVQTKSRVKSETMPSAGAPKNDQKIIKIVENQPNRPVQPAPKKDNRSLRLPVDPMERYCFLLTKQLWKSVYGGQVNGRKLNEREFDLSQKLFKNHINRLNIRGMRRQDAFLILNRCLQIQAEQIEKGNFTLKYSPSYYLKMNSKKAQYGTLQLVLDSFYQNEVNWRKRYLPENKVLSAYQEAVTLVMIQIEKVQRLVEVNEFSVSERHQLVKKCQAELAKQMTINKIDEDRKQQYHNDFLAGIAAFV